MDLAKYASYFNILYNDDVYLLQPITGTDSTYGSTVKAWQSPILFKGNVQAYSGELAFNEYGLRITCEKRIFLPPDTTVSEGWGVAFSADAVKPELYVKWAPQNKTHRLILAGTR